MFYNLMRHAEKRRVGRAAEFLIQAASTLILLLRLLFFNYKTIEIQFFCVRMIYFFVKIGECHK